LQKTLGVTGGHAAANDQSKQVGAADSEEASDGRADQPLQADSPQLPLEQDDPGPDQCADSGILRPGQSERLNKIGRNRNYEDKKKTYKN
jgi:hypothetical protein